MKTVQPGFVKTPSALSQKPPATTTSTPKLSILQKAAMVNQQKLQQSGFTKEDIKLLTPPSIKPIQPPTPVVAPVTKIITKSSPPVVTKVQAKVISPASQEKTVPPPSPVTRTNEKSLILLEQDLMELKKGADSNQQRFPSFRESFPKKSLTQTTLNYYKKPLEDKNKLNIIKTPEKKEKPVEVKKSSPILSAKKTFLKRY